MRNSTNLLGRSSSRSTFTDRAVARSKSGITGDHVSVKLAGSDRGRCSRSLRKVSAIPRERLINHCCEQLKHPRLPSLMLCNNASRGLCRPSAGDGYNAASRVNNIALQSSHAHRTVATVRLVLGLHAAQVARSSATHRHDGAAIMTDAR